MITYISAVILGVVEGFTEFLPISSTAHLILVSNFLRISQSNFVTTFEIAIQSGAICAVIALFWRRFFEWESLKRIIVAFVPTGAMGLILYQVVTTYLVGNITVVLWLLAIGGVLLILFEYLFSQKGSTHTINTITYRQAVGIGFFQSLALFPGVSRSAATIIGGMLMGVGRTAITEFSFLLAVPTMFAATGLLFLKNYHEFSSSQFGILAVGFVVSFITAIIGIRFLLNYVKRHSFTAFGVYRIILVVVFLLILVW